MEIRRGNRNRIAKEIIKTATTCPCGKLSHPPLSAAERAAFTCQRAPKRVPFTSVKSCFHKFLLLCCALYLSGAHWMVLQATAWTGMLVTRTEQTSFVQAVDSTFSGDAPCPLCSAIKAGKREEQKQETPSLKKTYELKFLALDESFVTEARLSTDFVWPSANTFAERRSTAPPTRPPLL